jgi:hypothetical protein
MKQNRDVKFIIYQVLYIFMIVILTIKGADINLIEVKNAADVVLKTSADSLKLKIDSLLALGVKPEDILRERLDNIASSDPIIVIKGGFGIDGSDGTGKDIVNTDDGKKKEDITAPVKDIQLEIQKPVQYRVNQVSVNRNSEPLYIYGDGKLLTTVAPNQSGSFLLKGESVVVYKCGNAEKQTGTKENETQSLSFQSINAGNSEKSLRELQATVGWRVTIKDDYYDQIEVKITGPVKIEEKGKGTYDLKLYLCGSKDQFDRMFGDKDAPFRANFTVTATDKISGKKVSQMREFIFGEW